MSVTISQSDLETRFGETNIERWSDVDNSGSADTTRITEALAQGTQRVENAFRDTMYQIPFQALSGTLYRVKDWMLVYAGSWLYFSRGMNDTAIDDRIEALEKRAEAEMRKYQNGRERLNAARSDTMPSAPMIVR